MAFNYTEPPLSAHLGIAADADREARIEDLIATAKQARTAAKIIETLSSPTVKHISQYADVIIFQKQELSAAQRKLQALRGDVTADELAACGVDVSALSRRHFGISLTRPGGLSLFLREKISNIRLAIQNKGASWHLT